MPDTPPHIPTSSKRSNPSGNWQVIAMSNLVHQMLTTMKQKYDETNGDLSCSEEVSECQHSNRAPINIAVIDHWLHGRQFAVNLPV